jgi:mRNA interferase HicA
MKRRDFVRHLSENGCILIGEGGNHSWWGNPGKNRRSAVPRHSEINDHLAGKIGKDLDIPKI